MFTVMIALADQDVEVFTLVTEQAYEAEFPQQVMTLMPIIEGEQTADMQTFM